MNKKSLKPLQQGFTLIEMMLVIVLIGLMASVVQYSAGGDKHLQRLKQISTRFAGIFEVAAEYSMLNNVELGLLIEKDSYQFLAFDGSRWTDVGDNELLVKTPLPEGIETELELDDLPIEEPLLFDPRDQEEEDSFFSGDDSGFADKGFNKDGKEKKKKKLTPQVYILSGGDITPFSLTFQLTEELVSDYDSDELAPQYRVTGLFTTPLTIEGPTLED